MSFASRSVLVASCTGTCGIIAYVHYKQQYDREKLHLGVVRDIEMQERRKAENIYILQQQQELTKHLKQQAEHTTDTG
ncbi:hypothetical protein PV325_010719 [Microctonus aethiopoides]|uniref:Uncharacterized protein n=1 Tax=Microctonus aethiopoides TaxID=144406 RepID=A0AA39C6L2_9HYME|nr:hypothetical protein PV325_010719 [Microctonus aethiopoides]KAK0097561.1 hypothetical protein PV326_001068 [Microctonus aethiopoides]KAK0158727.1 hypothetical protein PV328_009699 [Microctonus aethiopoides]